MYAASHSVNSIAFLLDVWGLGARRVVAPIVVNCLVHSDLHLYGKGNVRQRCTILCSSSSHKETLSKTRDASLSLGTAERSEVRLPHDAVEHRRRVALEYSGT